MANTAFLRSDRLESGSQPHPDKVRSANCAVSEHRWKGQEPGLKPGPVDSRPVSQSDSAGFQRQSVGVLRPGGARHSLRSPAACEARRGQRTSWNRRPTRNSRGLRRTVRPHNPREAQYGIGAAGGPWRPHGCAVSSGNRTQLARPHLRRRHQLLGERCSTAGLGDHIPGNEPRNTQGLRVPYPAAPPRA